MAIKTDMLGRYRNWGENPICAKCGDCCRFRENGGPLTDCRHLKNNICVQYDNRPSMCKNFWCVDSFLRTLKTERPVKAGRS